MGNRREIMRFMMASKIRRRVYLMKFMKIFGKQYLFVALNTMCQNKKKEKIL
jgi:uncharacterized protein YydD (DUF2326 family)